MGQNSSDTALLVFEEMQDPATHRSGREGEGYKIALANLEGGRIGIAAQSIGMARAALEVALPYAKERRTFGKPSSNIRRWRSGLPIRRPNWKRPDSCCIHAAPAARTDQPCLSEACMAELFASEMAERVCSAASRLCGGYGY